MNTLLEHGDPLVRSLQAAAVAADAEPMARYMKDHFEFLGVKSKARRAAQREAMAAARKSTPSKVIEFAHWCWTQPYREVQYVACDMLRANAKRLDQDALFDIRTLVVTKSWWDTVDPLAIRSVGPLVLAFPELTDTLDDWIDDDNMWLARVAILHQLMYKDQTDTERLFSYCRARNNDPEFFVRKAIGWALRELSKTDPKAVADFLASEPGLSPLSIREASKYLN